MTAPCRPLWAAVCRCVRPCGAGRSPSPHRGIKGDFGPLYTPLSPIGNLPNRPIFALLFGGRKWCRIKRWHHRSSHRPATRVGSAGKQQVCGRSSACFVGYDDDIIFTPPLPTLALPKRERLQNIGFRCPIDGITPDFLGGYSNE